MNKGMQQANRTASGDEVLTPMYAVKPLVKYLRAAGLERIWCPFDKVDSAFVKVLMANGFDVRWSHIDDGDDFFERVPPGWAQAIVSNPPYSKKDAVIERLYEYGLPFAMLVPLTTLQGKRRGRLFAEHGVQWLGFDARVEFTGKGGVAFATGYLCKDLLPSDLIIEKL